MSFAPELPDEFPSQQPVATRVEPACTFAGLSVATSALEALHAISAQVSAGLQQSSAGGAPLATIALFTGAGGSQKAAATQAIAHALQLPLYRVDLHRLTSKYIGETEKNLAVLFNPIRSGGAILLFDEGDALFGKRTEVAEGHDRYAENPILLAPQMEHYPGLIVIAAESDDDVDPELLKRVRYRVVFP